MKSRSTLAILMIVVLLALACSLTGGPGEEAPEATPAATEAGSSTEPTREPATPTEEPTAPPEPEPEDTAVRAVDGMEMVLVPAGEFLMGDDASAFAPEKPAHIVYLDEYWIDRYEVTNAQYRLCVEAGVCPEPGNWWNEDLNGDLQPVLVPWADAKTYCEWVGGRLPTEAEWEKAIRGTDGRTWPWGNEFVNDRGNLSGDSDGYGPTAPVGSFPDDVSPYGLLDAAGNAAEWVADWWDPEYYTRSPARNPTGPASGEQRVHRAPVANAGGGPEKSRCVARYAGNPNWEYGFRCVSATRPEG
jgi:formylglycine-generating enzyme required for sulfatase activity